MAGGENTEKVKKRLNMAIAGHTTQELSTGQPPSTLAPRPVIQRDNLRTLEDVCDHDHLGGSENHSATPSGVLSAKGGHSHNGAAGSERAAHNTGDTEQSAGDAPQLKNPVADAVNTYTPEAIRRAGGPCMRY